MLILVYFMFTLPLRVCNHSFHIISGDGGLILSNTAQEMVTLPTAASQYRVIHVYTYTSFGLN